MVPAVSQRRSMPVVVTGGAGFIGSHLCEALLERGHSVTCVDNLVGTGGTMRNIEHLLDLPRFRFAHESMLDWVLATDLTGTDCIFNLAASKHSVCLHDPERDLAVNGLGTLRLILKAAQQGVRKLVHASTGSVVGATERPHTESGRTDPVSLYGISKLAAESYCRVLGGQLGLDYTVLRYYHVIGPRQDGSDLGGVVPIFVGRCLEGQPVPIHGTGEQTRSFTSVHDIVRANVLVAESADARQEVFNAASGVSVSINELAAFVIAETGSAGGVEFAPARPGDIPHFRIDARKLHRLGLRFDTDWRAMVREVIAAYRDRELAHA